MAFVITRRCRDCVDGACVDACPVDCILQEKPGAGLGMPNQLFINPDDCISCSQCEPACPWEAIFDDVDVPAELEEDIALNAITAERRSAFDVPTERLRGNPSPREVLENLMKWQEKQGKLSA